MKTEQPILITSILAAVDLSKNLFIGFNGNVCGDGNKALGVCNAETDSGEQAPLIAKGIALVLSGNAVSIADKIQSDANGKAIRFSSGEANGYAIDSCLAADELIRILLV